MLSGINIHADFAAVNVNFWITPDQANLDAESGGLIIWDVAAPLDWDFAKYNDNEAAIRSFLAQSGARAMTVPPAVMVTVELKPAVPAIFHKRVEIL